VASNFLLIYGPVGILDLGLLDLLEQADQLLAASKNVLVVL
jgi:hypothetical protein